MAAASFTESRREGVAAAVVHGVEGAAMSEQEVVARERRRWCDGIGKEARGQGGISGSRRGRSDWDDGGGGAAAWMGSAADRGVGRWEAVAR
jgi:hypothetical protein